MVDLSFCVEIFGAAPIVFNIGQLNGLSGVFWPISTNMFSFPLFIHTPRYLNSIILFFFFFGTKNPNFFRFLLRQLRGLKRLGRVNFKTTW